jgi:hypothetical protein
MQVLTAEQALNSFAQLMSLDSLKLSQKEHLHLLECYNVLKKEIEPKKEDLKKA